MISINKGYFATYVAFEKRTVAVTNSHRSHQIALEHSIPCLLDELDKILQEKPPVFKQEVQLLQRFPLVARRLPLMNSVSGASLQIAL